MKTQKTIKKNKEKKINQTDMNNLSENEMLDLLVELADSIFWPAIQKYNRLRDDIISNVFNSIDPFKEPTQMARTQGVRIGLYDLEGAVITAIKERNKKIDKETIKIKS